MRRPFLVALLVVVSLVAGAATTVGVSWGVARTFDPQQQREGVKLDFVWPREVPEHWPSCEFAAGGQVPGASISERMAFRTTDEESGRFGVLLVETGWPMRAMSWEVWVEEVFDLVGRAGLQRNSDGHPESVWRSGYQFGYALHHRLPLMPVLPGFAVNTLLSSMVVFLAACGLFMCGRAGRRRRGQCTQCGYPNAGLADTAICPECGIGTES